MMNRRFFIASLGILAMGSGAMGRGGDFPVHFLRDGRLLIVDASPARTGADAVAVDLGDPVDQIFGGNAATGNILVGLRKEDSCAPGCCAGQHPVSIREVSPAGETIRVYTEDGIRAYPSPDGDRVAVLTTEFRILLFDGDEHRVLDFSRRTTLVAWSAVGDRFCVTAYPDDWSPEAPAQASNESEFFRLINSDLYEYEMASGSWRQLTDGSGYDYSGVYTMDGESILFISSRAGRGAFHLLDRESLEVTQLTNLEPGSYEIPVGRSDSFSWAGDSIVYEAQNAKSGTDIYLYDLERMSGRVIGQGRQPRVTADGRLIIWLADDGSLASEGIHD